MEKRSYIERMLETENLTDELEDADAKWLLDWGIARLDDVLRDVNDPNAAGERVNALMSVMRKINHIFGSYATRPPQQLATDLAALKELHAQVFNPPGRQARAISTSDPEADALRLAKLSPREALEFLAKGPSESEKNS